MNVYWLLTAQERLRAELHGQPMGLAEWLPRLNTVLAKVFDGQVVLVRDRYSGYLPFDGLVILFVEVQPGPESTTSRFASPGTYIVKVAFDERRSVFKGEIDAWNNARRDFNADNDFVSLEAYPSAADPIALIYGDANAVLGQRNILSLEEAITQPCRFGVPEPEPVKRILRTLYERLNTRFFAHSHLEVATVYPKGNRPDLGTLISHYDETAAPAKLPNQNHDEFIRQIRRETLAMLAADHEQFADPIDMRTSVR